MKNLIYIISVITLLFFQSCIRDNEDPVAVPPFEGAIVKPNVGGAAEPNQVWFKLSDSSTAVNNRTNWDLGFYSGSEFKVILNSSIMMAARQIEGVSNLAEVNTQNTQELRAKVQVANFQVTNVQYVDDVSGNFPSASTAISEIKENDSENPIYLINMGKEIYEGSIPTGSVYTGGESRGWMKIQIVRSGDDYKIRYADLDATEIKEAIIPKSTDYHYTFFSMKNNAVVSIQPEKKDWDLCFTVFTNVIEGAGTYIYADFVLTNIMGGAAAYEVMLDDGVNSVEAYSNFNISDVDASKFVTNDQRSIGGNWRNPIGTNGLEVYGNRFYIIRDANGLFYKLKFSRMTSTTGERGYPEFEYQPL